MEHFIHLLRTVDIAPYGRPTSHAHTAIATPVATNIEHMAAAGIKVPSIAILVNVAKMPPAGVKPAYIQD